MKRFASIIFSLCLVVALMLTASAESTNKLTYAVGASAPTVSANAEFQIYIDITENTGICWLKTRILFDSSVLTFVGANTDTSVYKSATLTVNSAVSGNEGKVIVVMGTFDILNATNPTIYTHTGKYIVLNFKVKADAPAGKTTVKVETSNGDAIIIQNGNRGRDYELNSPVLNINITDSNHTTCTPGTEVKENEIPATCSSMGSYDEVVRCTICEKILSTKTVIIPVNDNHTPGEAVKENEKAGDCKTASSYDSVVYCTRCSKETSRTKVAGEKGDHVSGTPEVTVTEATCQKKGSIVEVYKCAVCGTQLDKKTSELAMTDHVKGKPVMEKVVAATCTKGGSYVNVVYCVTCNKVLSSESKTTEKIPHSPAKAVEENRKEPANCGVTGTYESVVYCSACKTEISRVTQSIPAPAHTPGPAATETTAQICTVCNALLASPLGHTHKWMGTWSTDDHGHWYACSGCSEKKDYVEHKFDNNCDADCNICGYKRTPADHVFSSWSVVEEATATTDGLRRRNCIICGYFESEAIPATGAPETSAPEVTTEPTPPETSADVTTEQTPDTSEPEVTTETTPVETTEPEVTTDSASGTEETPSESDEETDPDDDQGCGSAISMGIALIAILGTAIIMKKRD